MLAHISMTADRWNTEIEHLNCHTVLGFANVTKTPEYSPLSDLTAGDQPF
jgi:hypothetical protein